MQKLARAAFGTNNCPSMRGHVTRSHGRRSGDDVRCGAR